MPRRRATYVPPPPPPARRLTVAHLRDGNRGVPEDAPVMLRQADGSLAFAGTMRGAYITLDGIEYPGYSHGTQAPGVPNWPRARYAVILELGDPAQLGRPDPVRCAACPEALDTAGLKPGEG